MARPCAPSVTPATLRCRGTVSCASNGRKKPVSLPLLWLVTYQLRTNLFSARGRHDQHRGKQWHCYHWPGHLAAGARVIEDNRCRSRSSFCSAVQARRRTAPVNTSSRRTGSGSGLDLCKSSVSDTRPTLSIQRLDIRRSAPGVECGVQRSLTVKFQLRR